MDGTQKELPPAIQATTPGEIENQVVGEIVTNVKQLGHTDFGQEQARPVTAQTPIPQTKELLDVEALIKGSETDPLEKVGGVIGSYANDIKKAVVGGSPAGTLKNRLSLGTFLGKIQKQNPDKPIALVEQKRAA